MGRQNTLHPDTMLKQDTAGPSRKELPGQTSQMQACGWLSYKGIITQDNVEYIKNYQLVFGDEILNS